MFKGESRDRRITASDGGEPHVVVRRCRQLADHRFFQGGILAVIVINAAVLGLETSADLVAQHGVRFHAIELLAQAIFTIEIAIRLTAYWPRPLRFFREGWNTFDFVVIAVAWVPASGGLSNVGRLARIARLMRLISAFPELRLIVETMVRSLRSTVHILIALTLFLYVYAVVGVHLFAQTDADRWGSLGAAILTLFQVVTLEGWNDVQAAVIDGHPWSWLFFGSFIVTAVFVLTNLFVAVIINNLEAAKRADAERFDIGVRGSPLAMIANIQENLSRLQEDIRKAENEPHDRSRDPVA